MEIYVANLDRGLDEEDLKEMFGAYGTVHSTVLIRDRETRNSRGYGFVKMESSIVGERAIDDLHGRWVSGRQLVVYPAKPQGEKENRPSRGPGLPNMAFQNRMERGDSPESFHNGWKKGENLPLEVQDEASFSMEKTGDGLVKISFDKE